MVEKERAKFTVLAPESSTPPCHQQQSEELRDNLWMRDPLAPRPEELPLPTAMVATGVLCKPVVLGSEPSRRSVIVPVVVRLPMRLAPAASRAFEGNGFNGLVSGLKVGLSLSELEK